jgi:hypothetical protein
MPTSDVAFHPTSLVDVYKRAPLGGDFTVDVVGGRSASPAVRSRWGDGVILEADEHRLDARVVGHHAAGALFVSDLFASPGHPLLTWLRCLSGRFVLFPIIALELPHAEPAFASVVDGSGLLRVLNAVAMGEK